MDPAAVRVDLRYLHDRPTAVGLASGTIVALGLDGSTLARVDSGAARLVRRGTSFEIQTASSCGGQWLAIGEFAGVSNVRLVAESGAAGADGMLHTCGPSYRSWYHGEIRAVVNDSGRPRTINVVTIEQYLLGVVPNEMPASWPEAALQSQAVAARSYALAGDSRQLPYGDTCDTIRCQVYDGAFTERGGSFRASTHPRTDAAIAATAGQVRLTSSGGVARTEFSSSTGGYTAGGDFPAVADLGDAIAVNPNHSWTASRSSDGLEAQYGLGRLLAIEVTGRNGLGADGGRVTEVHYRFERGSVAQSGSAFRSRFGLKSDWYSIGPVQVASRSTAEGRYVDRTFELLAGRSATNAEILQWVGPVVAGDRRALTDRLVGGDFFAGRLVDDLYQRALGRGADAGGRRFWVAELKNGVDYEWLGVLFYGSDEYYARSGGTNASFVAGLYQNILSREPDAGGRAYWEGVLNSGQARLDDVAAGFYDSPESRRSRAAALYRLVFGSAPAESVLIALGDRLLIIDDLALVSEIASSREAYER